MKKILTQIQMVALGLVFANAVFAAEPFKIDPVHSTIGFTVSHLTVSKTSGKFTDFLGTVQFDPSDLANSQMEATIQTASIDTGVNDRDNHLRSEDFFDVKKYPTIIFKSTNIEKQGDSYVVSGDLTMHGITKNITIPMTISGPIKSPFGSEVIGMAGQLTINRKDFGVSWNKVMDSGGLVVGEDVDVWVNFEASK